MTTIEEIIYEKIWDGKLLEKSDFSSTRTIEAFKLLDTGNMLLDVGCGEGTFANSAKKIFITFFHWCPVKNQINSVGYDR